MARPEKQAAVKEIAERFKETEAALLTEYRGLRVSEIAEVRGALREADGGSEYKVLKNTLARIAVREVGLEDLVGMLEGPTAIAFIKGDAAAAAKALDDAAKKYPVLTIKGGILNGKILSPEQAQELAKLEPREVLLSKVAMLMNSPAQQTVNVFAALLRDLGSMLAQVLAAKPAQAESETPATQAQAPEAAAEPAAEAEAEAEPPAEPAADLPEAQEQAEAAPESEAAAQEEVSGSEEE
ncbi:MAG: 50S ribosomal protein L10 [Actinomycetota bacterium]|nr:50S ribosomal protein L10 [Actinomycetota bacterium]